VARVYVHAVRNEVLVVAKRGCFLKTETSPFLVR
jgi:hypothetical protein